jgi:hypothetical protein
MRPVTYTNCPICDAPLRPHLYYGVNDTIKQSFEPLVCAMNSNHFMSFLHFNSFRIDNYVINIYCKATDILNQDFEYLLKVNKSISFLNKEDFVNKIQILLTFS